MATPFHDPFSQAASHVEYHICYCYRTRAGPSSYAVLLVFDVLVPPGTEMVLCKVFHGHALVRRDADGGPMDVQAAG